MPNSLPVKRGRKMKHDHYGRQVPKDPKKDLAMRRFAENIDMEAFEMIIGDSEDDKLQTLLAMIHDPAYAMCSFVTLARKCRLPLQRLQEVYTDGMRHIGLLKMAAHLPQVMEDVASDAENTLETCPRCDGFCQVPGPENTKRECPQCHGEGKVKRMGDKHARDLMFETAKLTGQKGPLIAIQQNFGGDARMETMLKKTRAIVLEPKKPVDGITQQE